MEYDDSIFILLHWSILNCVLFVLSLLTMEINFICARFTPIICNKETLLQYLLVILKHSLQNYYKLLKKCFFCAIYIVICLACLSFHTGTGVLSAPKRVATYFTTRKLKYVSLFQQLWLYFMLSISELLILYSFIIYWYKILLHMSKLYISCLLRIYLSVIYLYSTKSLSRFPFFHFANTYLRIFMIIVIW